MQTINHTLQAVIAALGIVFLIYLMATDTRPPKECYQLDGDSAAHRTVGAFPDFYITEAQYERCASYSFMLDENFIK